MRHIPNIITLLNLASGCIGIVMTFEGRLQWAVGFLWLGAFFDFVDGFAARILKQYSDIGKELDSLADVVTFGVLPASLVYLYLQLGPVQVYVPFFAFLLTLASAYRLAKFNTDQRQRSSFLGLPTPASGIFFSSLPMIEHFYPSVFEFVSKPVVLLVLIVLFSFLLISEIPMFSLKFEGFQWRNNRLKYIFLITSVVLLVTIHFLAIPTIVFLYVFLSLIAMSTGNQTD
jgi:CDP-diacylglycerol--serine O-phosphatidyltransferase